MRHWLLALVKEDAQSIPDSSKELMNPSKQTLQTIVEAVLGRNTKEMQSPPHTCKTFFPAQRDKRVVGVSNSFLKTQESTFLIPPRVLALWLCAPSNQGLNQLYLCRKQQTCQQQGALMTKSSFPCVLRDQSGLCFPTAGIQPQKSLKKLLCNFSTQSPSVTGHTESHTQN